MADPVVADPGAETPVSNPARRPRFIRDHERDAFFAEEASDDPSLRKKGIGRAHEADGAPVGKIRLSKYKDTALNDFNPLENLAYIGGHEENGQLVEEEFPPGAKTASDKMD